MKTLDKDTIKKIASLAMINIPEDKLDKFTKEISEIIKYVDKIKEVDTSDMVYESHVDVKNIFREDEAGDSLDKKTALRETEEDDGYVKVPNVL